MTHPTTTLRTPAIMTTTDIPPRVKFPTEYREELRGRLYADGAVELPRSTTFTPGHSSFEFGAVSGNKVGYIDITIYGSMTYGDRTDSGATVNIRRHPGNRVTCYTKSTTWDGRAYKIMPPGARDKVADAMEKRVGEIDWAKLAEELQNYLWAQNINSKLHTAEIAIEEARQATAVPARVWPLSA
jgi:hypothetical protein